MRCATRWAASFIGSLGVAVLAVGSSSAESTIPWPIPVPTTLPTLGLPLPTPTPVVPTSGKTGRLVVAGYRQHFRCEPKSLPATTTASCVLFSVPGASSDATSLRKALVGEYVTMAEGDTSAFFFDVLRDTSRTLKLPKPLFPDYSLADGSTIAFTFLFASTRVDRGFGGVFKQLTVPPGVSKAIHYQFLPSGKYFFVDSPGMGKAESEYFTDWIESAPTHLWFADNISATPKRIATGKAFMGSSFADDGRRIVYFEPVSVDLVKKEKRLSLQSLELSTGKVSVLATVTANLMPRSSPAMLAGVGSHIAYAVDLPPGTMEVRKLRVVDLVTGIEQSYPVKLGDSLVFPIKRPAQGFGKELTSGNFVVQNHFSLSVVSLTDLRVVYSATLPASYKPISLDADFLEQ